MARDKSFYLIKIPLLMSAVIVYSSDRLEKALICANTTILTGMQNEQIFECNRCKDMGFCSPLKYILHKHNAKECIPNKECIDCRLANTGKPVLFKDNRAAIAHARFDHRHQENIHCYLCGFLVEREFYKEHLKNRLIKTVVKSKTDISQNKAPFCKINNSFYKDE